MSTLGKLFNSGGQFATLWSIANKIDLINQRIKEVYQDQKRFKIELNHITGGSNPRLEALLRKRRIEVEEEEVVGFKDVAHMLLKRLTDGPKKLQIVPIVGMGGLGKTTVAKKLYNCRIVKDHFNCHAWSFVSKDCNLQQVILDILKSVLRVKTNVAGMEIEELKKLMKENLKGRKYIIFLDDVWTKEMWDDVSRSFPNNLNGSRIVITTRDAKVAKHATRSDPYMLRKLYKHEAWELFCKVFNGDDCPQNLVDIGEKLALKCHGLPLAIVVLAGMLAVEEQSETRWSNLVEYVSSLVNDRTECVEILRLSYRHLPRELRPCFLYFAAFPEDYEMNARRLIAMWIAEGFIQPTTTTPLPLELVGERYLDMLIDRSLVQIGERRTDGGVKTCRIHDLLRDLCWAQTPRGESSTQAQVRFHPKTNWQ